MGKKWKSYDYEFLSETDKGFVFKDKESGNKISLPKKFAEVETEEYDLIPGNIYKVFVEAWLANKNDLDGGGINDCVKKNVKLKKMADSGKAILIESPEGYEFWVPVSWVDNEEDIPTEEGTNFMMEISEWKYKKKIEESLEEEEVTGRRKPGGGKVEAPVADDFVEDDIPF